MLLCVVTARRRPLAFSPWHDRPVPREQLAGGAIVRQQCEPDGARRGFGWVAAGGGLGVEICGPQAGREGVDLEPVVGERVRVEDGERVEGGLGGAVGGAEPVPALRWSNCGLGPVLQVSEPVSLDTLTMRGCADRRSAGRNALVTATTPKTLVS